MLDEKKYYPKSIIVRMPNWVGDFVMATPVLTDLKKRFPKAKITVMCRDFLEDLVKNDNDVDAVFSFVRKKNIFSRCIETIKISKRLRKKNYDLAILLTNSFSSALWFFLGKIPRRLGYVSFSRNFFINMKKKYDKKKQHQVLFYKNLLSRLGVKQSTTKLRLYLSNTQEKHVKTVLKKHGYKEGMKLVGINPGASYGEAKCWPKKRFSAVAKELVKDRDVCVVFFGDHTSVSMIHDICKDLPSCVINLAGKTSLGELACLIKLCDVLLTNDSGPMHIASALGTNIVALFGSTCNVLTGPYNGGKVINKKVICSPCFKRKCPVNFICMKSIDVQTVFREIKKYLYLC